MISGVRGGGGGGGVPPVSLRPTRPFEEHPGVPRALEAMAARARAGEAAAAFFLPGREVAYEAWSFAYGTGLAKEMNILRPGRDGRIRGTLCVHVSGHIAPGPVDNTVAYLQAELAARGDDALDDDARFLATRRAIEVAPASDFVIEVAGLPRVEIPRGVTAWATATAGRAAAAACLQRAFALTTLWEVRATLPGGRVLTFVDDARARTGADLAVRLPVELPAEDGVTTLEAAPAGSAGATSYVEARRYHIHVGASPFDAERALEVAEAYMAAHAGIRWALYSGATPGDATWAAAVVDEDNDRKRLQVPPAPLPFADSV